MGKAVDLSRGKGNIKQRRKMQKSYELGFNDIQG